MASVAESHREEHAIATAERQVARWLESAKSGGSRDISQCDGVWFPLVMAARRGWCPD